MTAGGEGSTFGKYFLLKKIASGGMGEIFLAKLRGPVGFEKLLVIKRILAQHVENDEFVDMFFAEARIAAQLSHANIVQIYEMGEVDDAYFIAMEYVHGKSLRDIIDRARQRGEYIPPAHAIEILGRLAAGMAYAHNAADLAGQPLGIIHRDINPHNLLVSYLGDVKIIDFGIAKSEMSLHKTETGTIKGKFVYMSPEQSAAEKLDKRSDLFSIGICLYETLTFVNPFAKANIVLSLDAIQRKEPPPVSQTDARLAPFEPILGRALAKLRDERYGDCIELRDDLEGLLRSGAVPSAPQSLADYMHELFEDSIESERRMIADTDQANTVQIEAMREHQKREHRPGSNKYKLAAGADGQLTASADVQENAAATVIGVDTPARSRLPFVAILSALVVATTLGVLAVTRLVQSKRLAGRMTITEITPPAVTPRETPTALPADPPSNRPSVTVVSPAPGTDVAIAPTSDPGTNVAVDPVEDERKSSSKRGRPERDRRSESNAASRDNVGHGVLYVSTVPPVQIALGNAAVGQTVKLRASAGTLALGSGVDAKVDPFKITINYKVEDRGVSYSVDAQPWAIVRGREGIGLGRTPLEPTRAEAATVFEFVNPKEGRQLRVTLRYAGP